MRMGVRHEVIEVGSFESRTRVRPSVWESESQVKARLCREEQGRRKEWRRSQEGRKEGEEGLGVYWTETGDLMVDVMC